MLPILHPSYQNIWRERLGIRRLSIGMRSQRQLYCVWLRGVTFLHPVTDSTNMQEDCIFCKIVAGEIPSRTVYEDDNVFAFLDVNPLAPGHTLVIPKEHYERVAELPAELSASVFSAVSSLTPRIESAVDADATTIGINNGPEAGQEVPHVHAHIIPRFEGDGGGPIHAVAGDEPLLSDEEMDKIESTIRG